MTNKTESRLNLLKKLLNKSQKEQLQEPYTQFLTEQLILRDLLAIDRTILTNESTYLAYIRTGLTVAAAGASLFKFFDQEAIQILGVALTFTGIGVMVIGYTRFKKMAKRISRIKQREKKVTQE